MPLIDFWSQHPKPGIHPADRDYLRADDHVSWESSAEARQHATALTGSTGPLHGKLHLGLFPQPFVGNIRGASVYILFGNPGLAVQDYIDELDTPAYATQCIANLNGDLDAFGPLLPNAEGTGAYKYWNSTFNRLIRETGERLGLPSKEARTWVLGQVATIEAGAYHSKKFPAEGFAHLPSTQAALSFVRNNVMERVKAEKCVVFVWRQARLWKLDEQPGVMVRDPQKANGRYLLEDERKFLIDKLADVYRHQGRLGRM